MNEFVPYEEALALKELGFNKSTLGYYQEHNKERTHINEFSIGNWNEHPNRISSPLYQQAFRWFMEKYEMKFYIKQDNWNHWCTPMIHIPETNNHEAICDSYDTYEEAELACLRKLIEIVTQNKEDE